MTREEAIEAMLEAWVRVPGAHSAMSAVLDAARPWVEGLMREAVTQGASLGWDACETHLPVGEYYAKKSAIVARILEGK